jgi:hypothetical protein
VSSSSPPEIRVVAAQEKGAPLELVSSGEKEEEVEEGDSFSQVEEADFDDVVDVGVSVDIDEDEFDPYVFSLPPSSSMGIRSRSGLCVLSEFATTRLAAMISDSVSDGLSAVSASLSTSNSFNFPSPPPLQAHSRVRLSPVTEGKIARMSSGSSYLDTRPSEPGFDMITVLHSRTSEHTAAAASHTTKSGKHRRTSHSTSRSSTGQAPHVVANSEEDLFSRQKVLPLRAAKSALSSMMAASNATNPFSDPNDTWPSPGAASRAQRR